MAASLDKSRLGPFVAAGATTLLLLALLDAGVALARGASFGVAAMSIGFGVATGLWVFLVPLGGLLIWALLNALEDVGGIARIRVKASGLVLTLVVVHGWLVLAEYPAFASSFPLGVPYLFELGFVAAAAATVVRAREGGYPRTLMTIAALGVAGGLGAHLANAFVYRGLYPQLHASLAVVACTLACVGFVALFHLRRPSPKFVAGLGLGVALCGAAGSSLAATETGRAVLPDYLDLTVLGSTSDLLVPADEELENLGSSNFGPEDVPEFVRRSSMPLLPPAAERPTYGVLLVSIEAMRWDQTSLGNPDLDTTPNLARLAESAVVFENAYSPSSGTLLSMGSMMRMAPPSAAGIELWDRSWHGQLVPGMPNVAEEFAGAGWKTHAVTHDHKKAFTKCLMGFGEGFEKWDKVLANEASEDTDAELAELALASFPAFGDAPFFEWIFFVSPHAGYVAHEGSGKGLSPLDLYRQEIAFADAQLGRVLDGLEEAGLADRTIVIVVGDHGEEFMEHGGRRHKATVYDEVSHVPLVMRVPGVPAARVTQPTSLSYVFPWLLSELQVGETATKRITELFLPLMEVTNDAVLVELMGHERTQSALVWPDRHKLILDFRSLRHELYDLEADPGEKRNLAADTERAAPKLDGMRGYRSWRREHKNAAQDVRKSCRRKN